MIDLHSHILPCLDDGARNMDETLEMCRIAEADGIHTIIASPHSRNGVYNNDEKTILPVLKKVKEAVKEKGISIEIIPAVDMHIDPEVVTFFKQNSQLLLGERYVLLEFPSQSIPPYTGEFLFKMKLKGYIPIITHPERNTIIQGDISVLHKWVEDGAIVQLTAMSLTGEFGEKVRKVSLKMVQSGLVHFIATDAHSSNWRKPILSKGRNVLEEILDSNRAKAMVEDIPKKILNGKVIESIEIQNSNHTSSSFVKRLFEKKLLLK
ncbi:MAG: tyrosine protein phosphatase [Desulfosporosinus sp.]|nr:tyrosine protein phosphatase [Desulfobacteraceae bacterium]MBC2720710.1 tyrosine protein phosphatase [Desulfobacteraceae bacterium]MBC2724692.1 tyrosine protein phosphatase [Desulfosporosinus sp.]